MEKITTIVEIQTEEERKRLDELAARVGTISVGTLTTRLDMTSNKYGSDHQPFDNFGGFTTRKNQDKEVQQAIDGNLIGAIARKVKEIGLRVRKVIKIPLEK